MGLRELLFTTFTVRPISMVVDVNLLGDNIKKNTEIVIYASNEVDLEVKAGKTKNMLLSRNQNTRQDHN
jgi:hypothetical protein